MHRFRGAVKYGASVALVATFASFWLVPTVSAGAEDPARPAAVATPPSTTTRKGRLAYRDYQVGQCVTWDQSPTAGAQPKRTRVVSCDEPHIIEIAAKVDLHGLGPRYPAPDTWTSILLTGQCQDAVEAYLGSRIDPRGRYGASGLSPTELAWKRGDRLVWCGVVARPDRPDETPKPLVGTADGRAQARIYDVGTCFSGGYPAPCSGPHEQEITGAVDLAGLGPEPPTREDLLAASASSCQQLARDYLGEAFPDTVGSGVMGIDPGSWAAGRRSTECYVALLAGGPMPGPLRG